MFLRRPRGCSSVADFISPAPLWSVVAVAFVAALALWLPCVLHTLPPATPPSLLWGPWGGPALGGPLGGSCWGRTGSQCTPVSP